MAFIRKACRTCSSSRAMPRIGMVLIWIRFPWIRGAMLIFTAIPANTIQPATTFGRPVRMENQETRMTLETGKHNKSPKSNAPLR